jgi:hypothetical protein
MLFVGAHPRRLTHSSRTADVRKSADQGTPIRVFLLIRSSHRRRTHSSTPPTTPSVTSALRNLVSSPERAVKLRRMTAVGVSPPVLVGLVFSTLAEKSGGLPYTRASASGSKLMQKLLGV